MSSHNVISVSNSPVVTYNWKRRQARGGGRGGIKKPEAYIWLSQNLSNFLTQLEGKKEEIKQGKYKYLEVEFFPEAGNLGKYFKELEEYGLLFAKADNGKTYFLINDIDFLLSYLTSNIGNLLDYVNHDIAEDEYKNRQIILWKSFVLNTEDSKQRVISYINHFTKLKLNYIYHGDKDSIISDIESLSSTYSGIEVDVYNGVIDLSELEEKGLLETRDFITKLSLNENILAIKLDSYFGTEDSPNGRKESITVNIEEPDIESLPIVAILDTGVKSNLLTGPYLIEEGLDYTSIDDDPLNGDPFDDIEGHGTMVANEIIYGQNIQDYFLQEGNNVEALYPTARVLSVKVLHSGDSTIDYKSIFKFGGEFSGLIIKYGIKVVNISINEVEQKDFLEEKISKNAHLLDRFAIKYGVLFTVCTGNIKESDFQTLKNKYPNFEFYDPKFVGSSYDIDKCINISSPGDLLSGLTVGGAFHHHGACHREQNKCFSTSFFSRGYNGEKSRKFYKPDILSLGSGDRLLKDSGDVEVSHLFQTYHIGTDETKVCLNYGTSFSAPRVARALAIGVSKYPDFSIETIKGLLLHNVYHESKDKNFVYDVDKKEYIKGEDLNLPKHLSGIGLHIGEEEDYLYSDHDNKVTFILEGEVKSKELVQYSVPILKMAGQDSENKRYNKLKLKLSVSILPTNNVEEYREISLEEANEFHISGAIHQNGFEIVNGDLCLSKTSGEGHREIIVNWTSDYYGTYNKTYSETSTTILKDDLLDILGEDDTITLSIRGFNKGSDSEEKRFSAIFSVEDLGETNQIRNSIDVDITI